MISWSPTIVSATCQVQEDTAQPFLLFVALALGADAVLLGRPYLYGLAIAGQHGVEEVVRGWARPGAPVMDQETDGANLRSTHRVAVRVDDVVEAPAPRHRAPSRREPDLP